MRGRKPKLARLTKLEDARRMVGSTEAPECPEWLDEIAKAEWQRIVTELVKGYSISPLDQISLAIYCELYSDFRRLREELQEEGTTVSTEHGVKANPKRKQLEWTIAEMRHRAAEFGFSPAARSRIDVPPPGGEEEDELATFLAEGGS